MKKRPEEVKVSILIIDFCNFIVKSMLNQTLCNGGLF